MLQWDRAFDGAEISRNRPNRRNLHRGFNGTAPLMARKLASHHAIKRADTMLQWDRAFDGAEMVCPPAGFLELFNASMGPRL